MITLVSKFQIRIAVRASLRYSFSVSTFFALERCLSATSRISWMKGLGGNFCGSFAFTVVVLFFLVVVFFVVVVIIVFKSYC